MGSYNPTNVGLYDPCLAGPAATRCFGRDWRILLKGLEREGRLLTPVRERLALKEQAGSRQGAGQRPRQLTGPV